MTCVCRQHRCPRQQQQQQQNCQCQSSSSCACLQQLTALLQQPSLCLPAGPLLPSRHLQQTMLPVTSTAANSSALPVHATSSPAPVQMQSSPILLDIQTSVSPMLTTDASPVTPGPAFPAALAASEITSPVALAPAVSAQAEAPTPTLMPRASAMGDPSNPSPAESAAGAATTAAAPGLPAQHSPQPAEHELAVTALQLRPGPSKWNVTSWTCACPKAT